MRKIFTSTLAIVAAITLNAIAAHADDTLSVIFYEDFGTASSEKNEAIEDHVWNTNSSSMFSWSLATDDSSINVRTNNASDYDGASADGNLYFKGYATFVITGISTSGYSDITLTFGAFGKNKGDVVGMTLTCNDGTSSDTTNFSTLNLDETAKTWSVATVSSIAETSSLTLTYTSSLDPDDDGGIRLDDIKLTGYVSSGVTAVTASQVGRYAVIGRSVSSIEGDAAVYDITGRKVTTVAEGESVTLPAAGVYIVKTAGGAQKVAVR